MRGMTASVCAVAFALLLTGARPAAASSAQPRATIVHRVVQGDTLWSLARRYGTTPERLAAANGIALDAILSVGQALTVPVRTDAVARKAPGAGKAASWGPAAASTTQIYRVRAGDTLWSISRRFGTRPERLAAANGIGVDETLSIGQVLRVPVTHSVDLPGTAAPRPGAAGIAAQRMRLAALPSRGVGWAPQLLALSQRFLGVRYRWGGTSPAGFDCSGFLYYVFGRMGVRLPRTTYEMFGAGVSVPREELQAGDIVFFQTLRPGPSHAGIYLGDGRFIHASSGGGRVEITPMDHAYYARRYLGARRF